MRMRFSSRKLLLPLGMVLLSGLASMSPSSRAEDGSWFARSQSGLERLWSNMLGCATSSSPQYIRDRLKDEDGESVLAEASSDYSQCGKRALRSTSSRMLVRTIEDSLRQGGIALAGERFRLDSSIGWVWDENVSGEIDALVPLSGSENSDGTGQALFLQPGAVFWPGLESEDRIDANLGLVYRRNLTPDAVVGGSIFYDHDFKRGHQRVGLGMDLQSGILHTALNYYHPLNDWEEGRTDYEERPLQGVDLRMGVAWSRVQFDASVGAWRFEGEKRESAKWRTAFELGAGLRLLPGVFLEGGYEQHDDDDSLDSRWNAGLAFRFSLPKFEGVINDRSMAHADLWEPVKREKRILYEERTLLGVNLNVENAMIYEPGASGDGEMPTATIITGTISGRELRADETLEVVVLDSATAQHGEGYDFTFSQGLYGTDTLTGSKVSLTESSACTTPPCRMDTPANSKAKSIEIKVSALPDTVEKEIPEFIDIRIDVRNGSGNVIHSSDVVRVTIQGHGNTVEFSSEADTPETGSITEEDETSFDIALDINRPLPAGTNASITLERSGTATADDFTLSPADDNNGVLVDNNDDTWTWTLPTERETATLKITAVADSDDGEADPESAVFEIVGITGAAGWSLGSATTRRVDITEKDGTDRANSAFIWGDITTPPNIDAEELIEVLANDSTVRFSSETSMVEEDVSGGVHMVEVETVTFGNITRSDNITLRVAESGGSATVTDDYTVVSMVTIAPADTTADIPVTIVDDGMSETAETIELVLTTQDGDLPEGWRLGSRATHTVTILASDNTIGFALNAPTTLAETNETTGIEIAVDVNLPSPTRITLNVATTGTATDSGAEPDYSISTKSLEIQANATSASLMLYGINNNRGEGNKSIILRLSGNLPEGWAITDDEHTVTLQDDDRSISFVTDPNATPTTPSRVTEPGTGSTPVTVAVGITQMPVGTIAVRIEPETVGTNYANEGGGMDYTFAGETVMFSPSNHADKTFTFDIHSDVLAEPDELIVLTIKDMGTQMVREGENFSLGVPHTITIPANDNTVGFVSGTDATLGEDEGTATVEVSIDNPAPRDITLNVTATDDPATVMIGRDYRISTRSLTITAGETSGTITLTGINDGSDDGHQDIDLMLSVPNASPLPTGWTLGTATHTVILQDDDLRISFVTSGADAIPGEVEEPGTGGTPVTITARITQAPTAEIKVMVVADASSTATVSDGDYTLAMAELTFPMGSGASQTAALTVLQDSIAETEDETIVLTLADVGNSRANEPSNFALGGSHTITIPKNGNTVAFASASSTLTEGVNMMRQVTVNVVEPADRDIMLDVAVIGTTMTGAAVEDTNYTIDSKRLTIGRGQSSGTITLRSINDNIGEGNKTVMLEISEPQDAPWPDGWELGSQKTHTVTLQDDDLSVHFTSATPNRVTEPGGTGNTQVTVTVGIDRMPAADVTVRVAPDTVGTNYADEGSGMDYTFAGETVMFTSSDHTDKSFTFDIHGDNDPEVDEFIVLTLADDTGTSLTSGGNNFLLGVNHTITIPANDNTIIFAAPSLQSIQENGGVATITAAINQAIPADTAAATVTITPSGTGIRHFPAGTLVADYNLSAAAGNGTLSNDGSRWTWTLPKGASSATLTVTSVDNFVETGDRTLTLGFTAASLPTGWSVPPNTSHNITLVDDTPSSASKNTVGLVLPSRTITLPENTGIIPGLMLQLSNADGTPYTGSIPAEILIRYTRTNYETEELGFPFDNLAHGFWSGVSSRTGRGTININSGHSHSDGLIPVNISILDDETTEETQTFDFVITEIAPSSSRELWKVDTDANRFTVVLLASDNSVEFAQASSGSIAETGDSTLITLNIVDPVKTGETVTVDIGFAGATEGTDFRIIDGTATYSNGTLTLPTEASEATFTLQAVNNPADNNDKTLTLTLSNFGGSENWGAPGAQDTHTVNIVSNTRNTIGFSTDKITVAENVGTDTSVMLQLSNADGTPYTGATPANLSLEYTSTGTNNNDFSFQLNDTAQGSALGASGTVQIASGQSYTNGQIPITITITNDNVVEDLEEFVYTISPDSSSSFPTGTWNVDHLASSFTLAIEASDSNTNGNTVSFAAPSPQSIQEDGGIATITATISRPIPTDAAAATVTITPGGTGIGRHFPFGAALPADYTLSVAEGNGTLSNDGRTAWTWALPKGESSATLTVTAADNIYDTGDGTLTLDFTAASLPTGWSVPPGTSHDITLVEDAPPSASKNTIGLAMPSRTITLPENAGIVPGLMLKLSKPDGTPYTGSLPIDAIIRYTRTNYETGGLGFLFDSLEHGFWGAVGSRTGRGTIRIAPDQSHSDGLIPVKISIFEDETTEETQTFDFVITELIPTSAPSELWRVDTDANRFTVVILASDNSLEFARASSASDIAEAGGRAPVTLNIVDPIGTGETVTVDIGFTGAGVTEGTDFRIIDGTATYSNGTLTLPTEASEATFIVEAIDNPADNTDKTLTITLSNLAGQENWGTLGDQVTHTVDITSNNRNTIGFSTDTLTVAENAGTDTSLMLQLSKPDKTAFTGATPANLSLNYTSTGTNNSDFTIQVNDAGQGTTLSANGNVQIMSGQSYTSGQIPITITIMNDNVPEGVEEFVYTITRPASSSSFPTNDWNVDPLASSFTLVVRASDNSVEFAQASSGGIAEDGGSALITLNIVAPIGAEETVTVDIGFAGATEGTDFRIVDGTATYSNGTLTLPTEASEATFTLQAVDNPADSSDNNLTLTLSNLTGPDNWGALGGRITHTVNIIEPGTVGFAPQGEVRLVEAVGDNSGVSATFHDYTINLTSPAPSGGLDLSLASSLDGEVSFSAPVNTEATYDDSSNVFTVLQGQSSATVRVTAVNDTDIEGREATDVTLSKAASFNDNWGDIDTGNTQRRIRIEPNDRIVQFNTTQSVTQITQNTDVELLLHINDNTADHALPVRIKANGAVVYHDLIPNTATPGSHAVTFTYPSSTATSATFILESATLTKNDQTTHFPRNLGWRAIGNVELVIPILGDVRFASNSSSAPEGHPVNVDILINPPFASNSSVFLRSSGDAVTITGDQYDATSNILTLPAGANKVTVTVGTNADSDEMDGSATLRLEFRFFANTHKISSTLNMHEIKILETRHIGFAAPTIDTTYKVIVGSGGLTSVGHQPRTVHVQLNEPSTGIDSSANVMVSVSDTDAWAELNLTQDVELTLTASAQGDPALGNRPNPRNPDSTPDYSVPATVTIDKTTGTGTFTFRVLEDTVPEAREAVEIRLADGNNRLPTGWEIGSQSSYWVMIKPNDNAIRFAEWPRGNPGNFAGLDVSIREGETKFFLVLLTNYAYNENPFGRNDNNDYRLYVRSTTTNFRDDLTFANGNPSESSWDNANGVLRIKAIPFRGVAGQNNITIPAATGGGPVLAASLRITATQDNMAEGSEVIELTLEEEGNIPSYWGSITNLPDTGSPQLMTSTTFRITITDN